MSDGNVVMIDLLLFLSTCFMHWIRLTELLLQAQFILLKGNSFKRNQYRSISESRYEKGDI